jgi:NADH-quinone oxidoreductase subunit G
MTDSGRTLFKRVRSSDRLENPFSNHQITNLEDSISSAIVLLKDKKVAIVGSCHSTLEELYLLNRLSKITKSKKYIRGHFGDDDGILLSADRTPNLRGALYSGFTNTYPKDNLDKLNNDLKKGEIETLLVVNEDLLTSGVEAESLMGVSIIYVGTHKNGTSELAEVLIPVLTSFEKKGTFINRSFIAQGFEQTIPGLAGLLPDMHVFCRLLSELDDDNKVTPDPALIWKNLSSPPKSPFKGLTFTDSLRGPLQLDNSKWCDLPFVESDAMHFQKSN